jgi:septal ring factor EnvC (AmiA/AmiB activator)
MIRSHKESLAVEKNAISFGVGINRRIPVSMKIKIAGEEEVVRACLGCLKCWKRKSLSDAHIAECKNMDKHVEVCRSLIPEAHKLNSLIEKGAEINSEAIMKLKEMISNLQMRSENAEKETRKLRQEMAEMEAEQDEQSQKLFDVSLAIAAVIPPTLRCKVADYCNSTIRKPNDDAQEDEEYDFSHSILLTDSQYDYKHQNYIGKN